MLRKWTLKIFLRDAEVADHVEDLLARILQHLRDRALAEVQSVIRALPDGDELLQAVNACRARRRRPESLPGGTPGSCGWQAMRILCSFATGITRSRKYVMRSQ